MSRSTMMAEAPPAHADKPATHKVSFVRVTYGLINRAVMLTDSAMILLAGLVCRGATDSAAPPLSWLQTVTICLIVAATFAWIMRGLVCYRVERYAGFLRGFVDIVRALVPAALVAMVILEVFGGRAWLLHHDWFAAGGIGILAALLIGRQFVRMALGVVNKRGMLRRRTIIVGGGALADDMVRDIQRAKYQSAYELAGVFDPEVHARPAIGPGPGGVGQARDFSELVDYAQNYQVDLVIIALPWSQSPEIFELIRKLQWLAADVVVPFEKTGFRPQFAHPMEFVDAPLLQVMHRPFKGTEGLIKVAEDYVVATIGLLVASPILLVAALAIWITDGRPIFFRQPRVGFNSKTFPMLKFRTMTVDLSDDGSVGTKRGNQRITKIGAILRKTSIDEIPQLVNVLRGEMSVVGPRPHVPKMLVGEGIYSEVVRQYAARHRIKPGITGWAQINGMRGGIDSLEKAKRGADLDVFYVAHWSLRFDIRIMAKTLLVGLVGRNVF